MGLLSIGVGMEEFLSWLKRSSLGAQMLREKEEAITGKRQEAAAEIARLEAEREKVLPPLQKARAQALVKANDAFKAYREALKKYSAACGEVAGASARFDVEIGAARGALLASADEKWDAFRRELRDLHAKCGKALNVKEHQHYDMRLGGMVSSFTSNNPAVQARSRHLLDLIQRIDTHKQKVGLDVDAEIGRLRDEIPAVDPHFEPAAMPR